jgi:hypothetical protein
MITTLVQFKLKVSVSISEAEQLFMGSAPKYQGQSGLIRKYYLLSEDGRTAGGVYLWESREAAEKLFNDNWREFILNKYGVEPEVIYFHTPVVVDNPLGEILHGV